MKYKNVDYLIIKNDSQANKFTQVFESIEKETAFIKLKLGKDYFYEEINAFIKDSYLCPNKCYTRTFYITERYFTKDKQKEILLLKCVDCNTNFAVYREISL